MNIIFNKSKLILKNFPLTNRFNKSPRKNYKRNLIIGSDEFGLRILNPFRPSTIKPRVKWIKIFEPESHIVKMFNDIKHIIKNENLVIGSYSFKDDVLLKLFKNKVKKIWQISPKFDYNIKDPYSSFETYQVSFQKKIKSIKYKYGKCDLFVIRHSLEHAYSPIQFLECLKELIKNDGYLLIEIPDSEQSINEGSMSVFWEEHISYFSMNSMHNLLKKANFKIIKSFRYKLSMEDSLVFLIKPKLNKLLNFKNSNFNLAAYYQNAIKQKNFFLKLLIKFNQKKIYLFGAGHSGISFVHLMGISKYIIAFVDDDKNKINKYSINNIKIIPSKYLDVGKSNICLISINPENIKNIKKNNLNYIKNGGNFFSIYKNENNYFMKNVK